MILTACMLAVALLAAWTPESLAAQATTVTLQGVVTGNDGSVLQGAQVEVRNSETGSARGALVDPAGRYRVLGLAPGIYDVTVRAVGYRQQRREGVWFVVGQRATLNFSLEPGAVELEPIVITGARAFEVQRTDVSTAVLQEEMDKLPLNTRNVLNLAAIAPGIRTYAVESGRSVPAAGSLPVSEPRFSNLYVDGVEWKGMYVGQVVGEPQLGSMIPQEAVREFRVYLNPYDAEQVRGASYVISAVTHRGGKALEGAVFGFFQNKPLVARSTFQVEKPEYSRYQVGGNIRGPIVRDRLFFSLSYEGQFTDNVIDVVPGRPAANPGIWDRYAGTFKAPHRLHTALLRLTAPRGSHTLDAIWATRHLSSESGFGTRLAGFMLAHEAGLVGRSRVNSVLLRDTYTSRSLVNEISVHFLDLSNDISPLVPGPTLQYPGVQLGRNIFPILVEDRQLRAINKTSYAVSGPGLHVLRAGLEVSRVRTNVYRPSNKDGLFVFATDTSTQPLRGQIAIGLSDPTSTRDARAAIDGWLVGAYLQDQWQPVPSLAVTAGLRYDAEISTLNQRLLAPWASDTALRRALGEEFLNTGDRANDLDNVAPRLAVAWDALGSGRFFVRGGYGVMYDRIPLFGALNEAIAIGWRTYVFQNPGTTDPAELRRRVAAGGGTSTPNIVLLKDRLETPANRQWSFGVGHQLTDRVALSLDYVNQCVNHAYVSVRTNLRNPATGQRAIPNYGDITLWDDFGDARFGALLASMTYDRMPTRLNVAYTLGWAESEFAEFTTSDYPDSVSYTMQRSEGDERHRLVVSGFTELPFGLDLSGIAIVASPRPFLATVGTDVNQNGSTFDDWPNGIRTLRRNGWEHWYRTVDLRLGRAFSLPKGRLTVTAEVFNLFNSANHSEYQATRNLLGYGEPVGDYARRQAQLGMRYQF